MGDLDAAEEALQDAWLEALVAWRRDGLPLRPGAWLLTVARRRAIDRRRRRRAAPLDLDALPAAVAPAAAPGEANGEGVVDDDQLRLIFTCCAPGLPSEAQVALTLRLVAGLTVAEIARAFLTPEATIAQRLVRAKRALRGHKAVWREPGPGDLRARLPSVLEVIYLVFNEGYAASAGPDLLRHDLVDAALRLAATLAALLPREAEVRGLAALLDLTAARGPARTDADGALVLLEDQDRTRWDRALIGRGRAHLAAALDLARPGPYQIQAAIAACHCEAASYAATDWPQIVALYEALERHLPSPLVTLNRVVALLMAEGPAAAWSLFEEVAADPRLAGHHRLEVVRADLLRRRGRHAEAARTYARAAARAGNARERAFLAARAAACRNPPPGS